MTHKFTIFMDKSSLRNVWYVMSNGSFVAGPFNTKRDAIDWIREE